MNHKQIETAEQALQHPEYATALKELLFQLADDDFILAYRGSEWLGLAPHIEEDVAFSSMAQDTMGHAVMFYEMLEALGAGSADDLAQLRSAEQFRNAILVERPNGEGHYIDNPHYDWAYAIVRSYLYELFKQARLEALAGSTYQPLVLGARKMMTELRYHLIHWQLWTRQLANSTEEAQSRMQSAVEKVWADLGGLFSLGTAAEALVNYGLIESAEAIRQRFLAKVEQAFAQCGLAWPGEPQTPALDGRAGEHTEELTTVLATLSEVYRLDPATAW